MRSTAELMDQLQQERDLRQRLEAALQESHLANAQLRQELADRQAVADLKQSEQKFRAVFDHMFQLIGILSPDGAVVEANRTALDAIGISLSDVVGQPFWDTPWWTHSPQLQRQLEDATVRAAAGEFVRFEAEHILVDGTSIFVDFSMKPVWDEMGKVVMLIPEGRDISDRKQVETQLREQEAFLKSIYDGTEQAIFVVNVGLAGELRYASFNPVSERYANITQAEIQDKTPAEAFGADLGSGFQQNYERCMQAGTSITYEEQLDFAAHRIWTLTTLVPLRDEHDRIYRIIGTATDITDRKRQEEDLARSNAELQQFAYVASHDLQEPLRMVTSYLELLERRYKGQLDSKADQFINYAVDGAVRMQTLINALLTYSRVGSTPQSYESIDCAVILQDVLTNLQVTIAKNSAIVTHDPLPAIHGDRTQLIQLLQNLISNGIKFRREDTPHIHIGAKRLSEKWLFSIRDNGIGIEAQYTDRIFVIFQRLNSRAEHPGTGIGLSICKKIVERHGGNLWVESQPDQGSTFYFTLPLIPKNTVEVGNS
jgi:PAS domain S-box-containing protein